MAAMTNAIRVRDFSAPRFDWKATLLSEVSGLVIGVVTLAWILASLNAL